MSAFAMGLALGSVIVISRGSVFEKETPTVKGLALTMVSHSVK